VMATPTAGVSVKPIETACTRGRFVGRVRIEPGLDSILLERLSAAFDRPWNGETPRFSNLHIERDAARACYVMSGPLGRCTITDVQLAHAVSRSAAYRLLDSAAICVAVHDRGAVRVLAPPIVIY